MLRTSDHDSLIFVNSGRRNMRNIRGNANSPGFPIKLNDRILESFNSGKRDVDEPSQCIQKHLDPILENIYDRLIAQTYDEAAVMCGHQRKIQKDSLCRNCSYAYS